MTNLPEPQLNPFLSKKPSEDPQQILPQGSLPPTGKAAPSWLLQNRLQPLPGMGALNSHKHGSLQGQHSVFLGGPSTCCHPQPPERHFPQTPALLGHEMGFSWEIKAQEDAPVRGGDKF